MLTKLAIWYLRKRKVSVLLNYHVIRGRIQQKSREAYLYDNDLRFVDYRDYDGSPFYIPEGKFNVKSGVSE